MTHTAASQFEATSTVVEQQIAELQAKLEALKTQAKANPRNWGYAGSMGKVSSDLADLIEFLG